MDMEATEKEKGNIMEKHAETLKSDPLKLYTTPEAAKILRKTKGTLANWRRDGIGPSYIKEGKKKQARVLYRAQDLLNYLESNQVEAR